MTKISTSPTSNQPIPTLPSYRLREDFLKEFEGKEPNWPSTLSKAVFYRTYSRIKDDGTKEHFWEVIRRCVEGCFTLYLRHFDGDVNKLQDLTDSFSLASKKQYLGAEVPPESNLIKFDGLVFRYSIDELAEEMYKEMFAMNFLPPGRGLWMMGTEYAMSRSGISLNNCAMVSTKNLFPNKEDGLTPFGFLMDVSMLGAGCGFDTLGADSNVVINEPVLGDFVFRIPDSREGWVESVDKLIMSYLEPEQPAISFDYNLIRGEGELIRGFGGKASGSAPLKLLHERIRYFLDKNIGKPVTSRIITDIMNSIGACVVAGNVRRSSLIALSNCNDEDFLKLKDYTLPENEYRGPIMGYSNNSMVFNNEPYEVDKIPGFVDQTVMKGEPGYLFLTNCKNYGRLNWEDPTIERHFADLQSVGTNPCGEMTLYDRELCNLVELFPTRAKEESWELWDLNIDFTRTVKLAYLYAKSVTLAKAHLKTVQRNIENNRRLGISISGIALALEQFGEDRFFKACDNWYKELVFLDRVISRAAGINESIKLTTIKPSGTVSILAGVTSGVHYPTGQYYLKRLRIATNDPLTKWARDSGFHVEYLQYHDEMKNIKEAKETSVIYFPVKFPINVPPKDDVSVEHQFKIIEKLQKYWSDNQVSATVTFYDREIPTIKKYLSNAVLAPKIKSVSFIRHLSDDYLQMPESKLTPEDYEEAIKKIDMRPIELYISNSEAKGEEGCTNDTCSL